MEMHLAVRDRALEDERRGPVPDLAADALRRGEQDLLRRPARPVLHETIHEHPAEGRPADRLGRDGGANFSHHRCRNFTQTGFGTLTSTPVGRGMPLEGSILKTTTLFVP